jgi:hypothetical protein
MKHEIPQDMPPAAVRPQASFKTSLQIASVSLGSPVLKLSASAALKDHLPGDTLKWWLSGVEGSWLSRSGMLTAPAAAWICGRPGAAVGACSRRPLRGNRSGS